MIPVERIEVSLDFGNSKIVVGELVINKRKLYIKYNSSFVDYKIEISPFKLPLSTKIIEGPPKPFNGNFGVFNDSLPDSWGRLLLDRQLRSKGFDTSNISILDRLSFVGNTGLGALSYKPIRETIKTTNYNILLDQIKEESNRIIQGDASVLIDQLYNLGGSSGGALPKINVAYNSKNNKLISGYGNLKSDFEHWLIKFPSKFDRPDIANIEYAYSLMAKAAGLQMSACKLFETNKGSKYFGTKRFDRLDNLKLHMHTASGLLHDDHNYSNLDYGHLMDLAFQLEKHVKAHEKVIRLAAFNVFAHNRDDHSKNISFLMDKNGRWQLAPAYDLTFSTSSHGQHSTTINGEGNSPTKQNLLELCKLFGVKNGSEIIHEVRDTISKWRYFAQKAEVSKESIDFIEKVLQKIK